MTRRSALAQPLGLPFEFLDQRVERATRENSLVLSTLQCQIADAHNDGHASNAANAANAAETSDAAETAISRDVRWCGHAADADAADDGRELGAAGDGHEDEPSGV